MIDIIDTHQLNNTATSPRHRAVNDAYTATISPYSHDISSFPGDQVSINYFRIEDSATYSSTGSFQKAADTAYNLLRGYVLDVFEKQGMDFTLSIEDEVIDLRNLDSDTAEPAITQNGYFGVEQTAGRIVDFAIEISGNNPARLNTVLEGVELGFKEALDSFGGWLPDISRTTYNRVLEKLDNWYNEAQTG